MRTTGSKCWNRGAKRIVEWFEGFLELKGTLSLLSGLVWGVVQECGDWEEDMQVVVMELKRVVVVVAAGAFQN